LLASSTSPPADVPPTASRPSMPDYGISPADGGSGLLPWSWAVQRRARLPSRRRSAGPCAADSTADSTSGDRRAYTRSSSALAACRCRLDPVWARDLRGYRVGLPDLVVVSELQRVELPAGSKADLTFHCPPMTVVVRVVQLVCGPSTAQRLRVDRFGLRPGRRSTRWSARRRCRPARENGANRRRAHPPAP
jgi:hypothetical protein